jgi:hypothetical protein
VAPRDQAFLESLVRYTEDASYRGHPYPIASHRSNNQRSERNTYRVEPSVTYPTSTSPTPRLPNLNRMSYVRSPHPPSSYHSCAYTTTSKPHPHANHPANSWYSSDTDDHSENHDHGTHSRTSTSSSLFYRPITRVTLDLPSATQSRSSSLVKKKKKRPEPLKITSARPRPTPIQVSPILVSSRVSSPAFRVPSITLSLPSASGEYEKFAFPTPPTHLHVIHEPKRTSGHWLAGHTVVVPQSDFTQDLQAHKTEGWEARMAETFDSESVSSCQAAEDVELRSSNTTFFTYDSGTVTTPTIDLPTPTSESFGFGFGSSVSTHLWGRQAALKHDLSLDESHSAPSQSDLSGNTPVRPGLILDDEDVEFVGELESVYSAFADLSMSSAGGAMQLSTMFGMNDTMSDTESVTDPHLHSVPVRIPRPRVWMDAA